MTARTALLYSKHFLDHDTGVGHPERPERVKFIYDFIKKCDLAKELLFLEPSPASVDDVALIHPANYIKRIKRACLSGEPMINSPDTAISPASFDTALLAVGGVLTLADAVMSGKIRNGFALVRPPGHHAEREMALGFCLFNNVAIAAKYIQKKYGLKRVLVIDWDVHHGNGTQHIFEQDPSVFYFSTHQSPYYPGTGSDLETGKGKGQGMTLNVPLPADTGEKEFKHAFENIFYPQASKFKPEFILISCGFDAHADDPLAQMNLTEESFGLFTDIAMKLARENGHERIVSALEGGYNLEAIARSAYVHLKHLMR